jgi:hypothetical protein
MKCAFIPEEQPDTAMKIIVEFLQMSQNPDVEI